MVYAILCREFESIRIKDYIYIYIWPMGHSSPFINMDLSNASSINSLFFSIGPFVCCAQNCGVWPVQLLVALALANINITIEPNLATF